MRRIICSFALFVSILALNIAATENTWVSANGPSYPGFISTVTLLANGKVLVAGGLTVNDKDLKTTLIYDPVAKSWTNGPSMLTARDEHTATLLADGRVLVAGGIGGNFFLNDAELYDPVTNKWTAAAKMTRARSAHTATLLPSGKVLVCGGVTDATTEIYDPATNTWTPGGTMSQARAQMTATLLKDGRVLIAGGVAGDLIPGTKPTKTTEIYDPVLNTWSAAGSMNFSHGRHQAVLFSTGNVLVIAGDSNLDAEDRNCEIYNPSTNKWTLTGMLTATTHQDSFTATLLDDDRVLVVNGKNDALYLPSTGTWIVSAQSKSAHNQHGAVRLANGNVLVAGDTFPEEIYIPPAPGATLITSALTAEVAVGKPFTYKITADGIAPITFSVSNLPAGLSLTGGNTISGTPTQAGLAAIIITATNASGSPVTQILRLTITGGGTVPATFASEPVATPAVAMINQVVTFTAAITNPDADLVSVVWNFGDGSFAVGSSVTHTYVAKGIYSVNVSAGDATVTSSKTLALAVLDGAKSSSGIISFSESYKDVIKTFHEGGETSSDVAPTGSLKLIATINGAVQASDFTNDTGYLISVGNLSLAGTLGSAQKFSDGTSAKFVFTTISNKEQEIPIGGFEIKRSSTALSIKLSTKTADAEPSIYAAQLQGTPSGAIDTTIPVTIIIGNAVLIADAKTTGAISTINKNVGSGGSAPLTSVSLKGSATATGN